MVLNQPALPKATWAAEVRKTINAYKAPIDEANVASIVAILRKPKARTSGYWSEIERRMYVH
jgi:hypothetical protein